MATDYDVIVIGGGFAGVTGPDSWELLRSSCTGRLRGKKLSRATRAVYWI